jgi:hypothetical protein
MSSQVQTWQLVKGAAMPNPVRFIISLGFVLTGVATWQPVAAANGALGAVWPILIGSAFFFIAGV